MKKLFLKAKKATRSARGLLVLLMAYLVLHIARRDLLRRDIWLVCEKRNEARDNGYHFYKYLKEKHPEVESYYAITRDAVDLPKVTCLGNVIIADSFRHALYYLAAARSISSQAYGAFPYGFNRKELKLANQLCNPRQKTVFLQHGITKDELSHEAFDYGKTNIDYFVCSAKREYEFVKAGYGYPDGAIGCVGLCRFDNLHRAAGLKEKIILVMPTWRFWLKRNKDGVPLTNSEIQMFRSSDFYKQFATLITSEELLGSLKQYGYRLYFYMHYQLQDYSELFGQFSNESVTIADRYHYDVQDLLMRAGVLVTDYSSVQFDFAYMNKPMVYFQFDKAQFESEHYAKGYFSYDEDGFGPCCKQAQEVSRILQALMRTGAAQPEMYQQRIDGFFNIRDDKNCERTFQAVSNL